MTPKTLSLVVSVALVLGTAAVVDAPAAEAPSEERWDPWFQAGLLGSTDLHRAETEFFLPFGDEDDIFFLDLRGNYFFSDFEIEGNFMAGWRHMLDAGVNIGLWTGGDIRKLESDNTFWQYSIGAEVLHPDWDMRINGYIPISDSKRADSSSTRVKLSGNRIYMTGGREVPMAGFDGEVGWRMPLEKLGLERDVHELRLYAGGFYFTDDDALRDIAGPRGRLEWQWLDVIPGLPGSRLVATAEVQWDQVRDVRAEGGLHLRIPFSWGFEKSRPVAIAQTRQSRRMTERVIRDVDIVASRSGKEAVKDALTDVRFDRVVHADATDDITAVAAAAGGNSLILANANAGELAGGQALLNEQTVLGGSAAIYVRGIDTGTLGRFEAPGSRPTIQLQDIGEPGDFGIVMADATHIAGFDILGTSTGLDDKISGETGVWVWADTSNVFIEQLDLRSIGDMAIHLDPDFGISPPDDISIFDLRIFQSADEGIVLGEGVSDVDIHGVTITDIAQEGIDLRGGNSNIRIHDVVIDGTEEEGIRIVGDPSSDIHISNLELSDADHAGITIGDGHTRITIEDSVIADTDKTLPNFGAILMGSGNTDIVIRNVVIDGSPVGSGLSFDEDNVALVEDVHFTGFFGHAVIDFNDGGNVVTGAGNSSDATFGTAFCEDAGGNPLSNIQFGGGGSCP